MIQNRTPDTSQIPSIVQAPSSSTSCRSPYPLFDRLTEREKEIATNNTAAQDHRNRRDQRDDSELEFTQTQLGIINAQKSYWIRAFYNAIVDMTGFLDKPSTPGFKKLFNDKETFYNVQDILAGASRVWEVFFDGARHGWLRPRFMTKGVQQRIGKKAVGDWFTRLNDICLALKTEKKTCVEVIEDNLTQIKSLVFCPGVYVAVKQSYRRCNDSRQAAIAATKKEIEKKDEEKRRKRKRDGEVPESSARMDNFHCHKKGRSSRLESPCQQNATDSRRLDTHLTFDNQLGPPESAVPVWEQSNVRYRAGNAQEDFSSLVAIPRKCSVGNRSADGSGPQDMNSMHSRRPSPYSSTAKSFGKSPASTSSRMLSSLEPYSSSEIAFDGNEDRNDSFENHNGDRLQPDGLDNTHSLMVESHPPANFVWDGLVPSWADEPSLEPPGPSYQSYVEDETAFDHLQTHGFGYGHDDTSVDDIFGLGYGQEANNMRPS